jgi:integrase
MQERIAQIGDYWLSKRPGSGQWCRTWYDAATRQTKRASLGTDDFPAAKVALAEWVVRHAKLSKQAPEATPFEQVLVRYWHRHGSTLKSKEVTEIALAYWSEFFAGSVVAEVTKPRQREFVEWLRARRSPPLSDGYIKRILGVAAAALNDAHKEGELLAVPYILPGEDAPARDRVLTLAESAALWLATELPHERMMLALLYGTLARPEAALELRREFVDFDRGLIAQNPPGRKQTKKFRPVVPLAGFLRPWLEAAPAGPLVAWRGKPIKSFKTAWRALRRRAWLPADVVPKTIRHTMATELRAANVPEAEIQGFLGHRAFGGKTEVYAKYRPDYLGEATQAIDGYMTRLRASCVLERSDERRQSDASL